MRPGFLIRSVTQHRRRASDRLVRGNLAALLLVLSLTECTSTPPSPSATASPTPSRLTPSVAPPTPSPSPSPTSARTPAPTPRSAEWQVRGVVPRNFVNEAARSSMVAAGSVLLTLFRRHLYV